MINLLTLFTVANDIPQCKPGDTVCLPKVITDIVHQHPDGHAALAIPKLEPLHINRIDISQGNDSPVQVNLNLYVISLVER